MGLLRNKKEFFILFILFLMDCARMRLRGGGASIANFVDIFLYQIIKILLNILKSN